MVIPELRDVDPHGKPVPDGIVGGPDLGRPFLVFGRLHVVQHHAPHHAAKGVRLVVVLHLAAFGNVQQPEILVFLLVLGDNEAVAVGSQDRDAADMLLAVVDDLPFHPIDRLRADLDLAAHQPRFLLVRTPDIGAGAAGAEQVGVELADHGFGEYAAAAGREDELSRFRFGFGRRLKLQTGVTLRIGGLAFDQLEVGRSDDRGLDLFERRGIAVLLIDPPTVAVPRQRELSLGGLHLDPGRVVDLLGQIGKRGFGSRRERRRLQLAGNGDARGHDGSGRKTGEDVKGCGFHLPLRSTRASASGCAARAQWRSRIRRPPPASRRY